MPRETSQEDADQRAAMSSRLEDATDRAAKVLDVDPEKIMYDVRDEQVCIPIALFEQLLLLAPRPITVPDDASYETAEYLGRLGRIAEGVHEAARRMVVEGVNYASGSRPGRFGDSARYVNMTVVNLAADAGLGILLSNAVYADQAAADTAPVALASPPAAGVAITASAWLADDDGDLWILTGPDPAGTGMAVYSHEGRSAPALRALAIEDAAGIATRGPSVVLDVTER